MPDAHATPAPITAAEFAQAMTECGLDGVGAVAVAVSGGADSMGLCLLAHNWAEKHGVQLHALTVDHGLRAEAAEEAETVKRWLNAYGVSHHILRWQEGPAVTSALQARAREARYRLMGAWCRAHNVEHVLVAHHQDDQAETVLMRLRKGSGLLGLAAMARTRKVAGLVVARPLLSFPKARIVAGLEAQGQAWVEDPSNQNAAFERVRTRRLLHELEHEGVNAQRLASAAAACRRVRDVLEAASERALQDLEETPRGAFLALDAFNAEPRAVRDVALSMLLARIGGGAYPPSESKRGRLLDWLARKDRVGGPARTLSGCEIRLTSRSGKIFVRVSREKPRKSMLKGRESGNYSPSALALHG